MAKEEPEEQKQEEEKQQPAKPNKKASDISLTLLLSIIGGTVVVFMAFIYFLVLPYLVGNLNNGSGDEHSKQHSEQTKAAEHNKDSELSEEEKFMAGDENIFFEETGQITTNPKGSDKFVVINLGLEFRIKEEIEHGEGEDGSIIPKRVNARLQGKINSTLGSMTEQDLHSKRDSLPAIFKERLKPVFKKNDMYLRDVILQRFIIQ